MQLRVARLCLDCEELHTDNRCPRCASESYVFLSSWLPVEERRRWRRGPATAPAESNGTTGLTDQLTRWLKGDPEEAPTHPTTRASDHVVHLDFDDKPAERPKRSLNPRLSKHGAK